MTAERIVPASNRPFALNIRFRFGLVEGSFKDVSASTGKVRDENVPTGAGVMDAAPTIKKQFVLTLLDFGPGRFVRI
jgi:hypothetical protein